MKRFVLRLALGGVLLVGAASAEVGTWEARGDAFSQSGNYERASLAYETALASDPKNSRILAKFQEAFLQTWQSRRVEADAGKRRRGTSRNRMGALPATPEPEVLEEVSESVDEAEGSSEGASDTTTDEAEEEAGPGPESIRVRKDGTIELKFGRRSRVNRMGALSHRKSTVDGDEEPGEGGEEEPEEDPGPKTFGGGQKVAVSAPRQGFEGSQGEDVEAENSVVRTTSYEISAVKISYGPGKNLHIKGKIKNIGNDHKSLPRVYASIFDEDGTLRGRNFSYVGPGRNRLAKGRTKKFDVLFRGFSDPVASYNFEVIP